MNSFTLLITTLAIGVYALNLDKAKRPESRIVDGIEASPFDFPYQVGIVILTDDDDYFYRCGGALISERHVLTAAHCFNKGNKEGFAFMGSNRFGQGFNSFYSRIDIHENYDPDTVENDIAIIHLENAFIPNNSTIKIIDLDTNPIESEVLVTVSGYGDIADNVSTEILYYTQLITIKNEYCDVFSFPVLSTNFCAIDGNDDGFSITCKGDSGGPVVRNWPDNPVHVGIVSFGDDSCHTPLPDVYTRTAKYIDWIKDHMN